MMCRILRCALVLAICGAPTGTALAAGASYHHMHMNSTKGEDGADWYIRHMGCAAEPNRPTAARCGETLFLFNPREAKGPSEGSGADYIGFSVSDVAAQVKTLQAAGVKIASPVHKHGKAMSAVVTDPWGTKIELVQDGQPLGFNQVHLLSADAEKTLAWYQKVFGGERKKSSDGDVIVYGKIRLFISKAAGPVAATEGRSIDHVGFSFPDLEAAAVDIKQKGVVFQTEPRAIDSPSSAKISFITGPDEVRIEVVEPRKK